MLKHEPEEEKQAAYVRVTPAELAQAVADIEAQKVETVPPKDDLIAIGATLQELGIEASPEEVLAAIEKRRERQATEGKTRSRIRRRQRVFRSVATVCALGFVMVGSAVLRLKWEDKQDHAAAPLIAAVNHGDIAETERLLAAGISPNARSMAVPAPPLWVRIFDPLRGRLPALTLAAGRGDVQIVKTLLDHGADVNIRDNLGSTPLTWASSGRAEQERYDKRFVKTVETLIANGADVNAQNERGDTPLKYARFDANPVIQTALIQHGGR